MIDLFAQFDVILIAIMLSGIIVKMGKGHGHATGNPYFLSFYTLFLLFLIENVLITVFAEYVFIPFLEAMLPNNFYKVASLTATMALLCNIWFAFTFGYKQRLEMILFLVVMTILTILLFVYT